MLVSFYSVQAQITVNSLANFYNAVQNSNQEIIFEAGDYYLESLPINLRVINCSGSKNVIDMTGVSIKTRVGSIREAYFIVSGDENIIKNGTIEDYYASGLEEVTDFSAYNNNTDNLAYGLKGDPIMSITGDDNLIQGLTMTVKGSFPYGYGSQYGIGSINTFGLNKRCGILVTGTDGGGIGNTLDDITMYHHAFGHGIYIQDDATETLVKNCYIEGRMRLSDDMYNDTKTYDLPYRTNYTFPSGNDFRTFPFKESYPIPYDVMYPLSEDGIRSYNGSGSVIVENCTVKQMRGGIRLYLATSATVINCKAIDCGATNFNMPKNGKISGSSGNFSFAPLNDFRLSRSDQNIDLTIIPSPNAVGSHNIADVLGNNHHIVFHRTEGPLDTNETRSIVIYGDNSTIINETEYRIILDSGASGNKIYSCGIVTNNGSNNSINDCDNPIFINECEQNDAFSQIEAINFCSQSGTQAVGENSIGYINTTDWIRYNDIDFSTGAESIEISAATKNKGGNIEIRLDSITGSLIGTVLVSKTGSFTNWQTFKTPLTEANGKHDVYFVFSGGSGYLFDVNWFKFSTTPLSNSFIDFNSYNQSFITSNLTNSTITIKKSANSNLSIYDLNGSQVHRQTILSNEEIIDISSFPSGIYFVNNKTGSSFKKLRLIKL